MNDNTLSPYQNTPPAMSGAMADSSKAIAEVHAALSIAKMNPRNQIQAIDNIKNTFARVGLAEIAQYQYARGGTDIIGPSIRSAEAIAQLWGNIQFGFREINRGFDNAGVGFSEVEAYAWDVETNTKRPTTFIVKHWRDTKSGGYALESERDIYETVANMAQRRVRACILAIVPADVVEVAMRQAAVAIKASADTTPEAMSKMVESFIQFDVTKQMIEARIQRRIDAIQPAQVVTLKRIYVSLRDGISESSDWFDISNIPRETDPEKADDPASVKELPSMPDDVYKDNLAAAKKIVTSKRKTPQEVIDMLSVKYSMSEDQTNAIHALAELIEGE